MEALEEQLEHHTDQLTRVRGLSIGEPVPQVSATTGTLALLDFTAGCFRHAN